MLLSLDGTLWIQLVNFIVFLLILNVIFLRPVGRAIAERRQYIDSVSADIEQFESDVKAMYAQAGEKVGAARRAADGVISVARAEAQNEAAAVVADHQEQAAAIADEAHATVALETAQARAEEREVIESLARAMLERAVGPEVAAR